MHTGLQGFEIKGAAINRGAQEKHETEAVGPQLSETLFDAGRRRATTESARAGYDAAVAGYRQTVLDAFQQVEDNLVVRRVLSTESAQQQQATSAAEESLKLFQNCDAGGVDTYLQVVTSQTTALTNERNDIDILRRRLEANVLLMDEVRFEEGGTVVHMRKKNVI